MRARSGSYTLPTIIFMSVFGPMHWSQMSRWSSMRTEEPDFLGMRTAVTADHASGKVPSAAHSMSNFQNCSSISVESMCRNPSCMPSRPHALSAIRPMVYRNSANVSSLRRSHTSPSEPSSSGHCGTNASTKAALRATWAGLGPCCRTPCLRISSRTSAPVDTRAREPSDCSTSRARMRASGVRLTARMSAHCLLTICAAASGEYRSEPRAPARDTAKHSWA